MAQSCSAPFSVQQISHLQEANARLQAEKEQLLAEKLLLQEELKELKRLVFGQKRERFVPATPPNQLSLQLDPPSIKPAEVVSQSVQYERVILKAAKVGLRQPFPS